MRRDVHEEARELLAAGNELGNEEQARLRAHLQECASCREYAERANEVIRGMRALPLAADARLVHATQMRVRFHASRLQESRERLWLVGAACLAVGLSATLTVPLLWRLFAWAGEWAGVSTVVWQAGFVAFWVVPALVVGALLVAHGTHLEHGRGTRGR